MNIFLIIISWGFVLGILATGLKYYNKDKFGLLVLFFSILLLLGGGAGFYITETAKTDEILQNINNELTPIMTNSSISNQEKLAVIQIKCAQYSNRFVNNYCERTFVKKFFGSEVKKEKKFTLEEDI